MAIGDLVGGRSERERAASELDADLQFHRRAMDARKDLMRLCPINLALDVVHAMVKLADLGGGAGSRVLQRTFLVRAMLREGWSRAGVAAAFVLSADELAEEETRSIWWTPPDDVMAQWPDGVVAVLRAMRVDEARTAS